MDTVDIRYAKEHLEELLDRASRGEDVRIEAPGKGAFTLAPADAGDATPTKRVPGSLKGKLTIPARLFEPLTEEELRWLSGEESP